ncbi:cadherin repeat domain-containing protein [Pseudochryseolinea flava]|uniref:SusE outer membrane protein domain-containing protein n=1 Tax=Pseudochryseolinea flava TaxID=2059302 RepID=A0A364Y5G6_9BACT|nr:hypothetical protein [Pseudochryseolinea flava]RAW02109.1 hypothetical protein DQQ10_06045 [Pseudochryseolinea flava]
MKKIYAYLSLILLTTVWACDEKDNMEPVGNWEITSAVITGPSDNANVVLDENSPTAVTRFEWQAAATSNQFIVKYTVALVPKGSTNYDQPIALWTPGNAGRELFVLPNAKQIDYALWAACYPAGADVELDWVVISKAIEKTAVATQRIKIKRFETEYMPTTLFLTGQAAEQGADLAKAVQLRARKNAEGDATNVFEVYTHLNAGTTFFFRDEKSEQSRQYGGENGVLTCGEPIEAPTTGEYKVVVDLDNNSYSLTKIDRWSLVGDAVEGGWGGDVPLVYIGNGVWQKEVMFLQSAGWIFRANGDWGYQMKRVKGTATADNKGGQVIIQSDAEAAGIAFEDMPGTTGPHIVKLDLSVTGPSYTLTKVAVPNSAIIGKAADINANAVNGSFSIEGDAPTELYLLEDGEMIIKFTKDGDVFKSAKYVALQAAKTYSLNSKADGSGEMFGGDDDGNIAVDHDQAYQINVDFEGGELSWKHYNIKLFHWDEDGGGWDARQELLMTYTHPYKYEVTGTLSAGFHSKFISPWDVQFGSAATALTGTMTNGGPNFKGITSGGSYKATIEITDDYTSADYSFVKQ